MFTEKQNDRCGKRDFFNVAILAVLCLLVGCYLIATMSLISHDGTFYIKIARQFSTEPRQVIERYTFGYPFLISIVHSVLDVFMSDGTEVWIVAGQVVSMLAMIFSIAALYFSGRLLAGSRDAFTGLVILIFLPYISQLGGDIVRDWVYMLFFSYGFLFLLYGAKKPDWRFFIFVGLAAGFGYLVREECAQLLLYAGLWIGLEFFRFPGEMSRKKLIAASIGLAGGFTLACGWSMYIKGEVLPDKLKGLTGSSEISEAVNKNASVGGTERPISYNAELVPKDFVRGSVIKGFVRICKRIGENLMYFYVLPLAAGLYLQWKRRKDLLIQHYILLVFIVFNVLMLILLYRNYGYVSRRHVLGMTVYLVFFIPSGLRALGGVLEGLFSRSGEKLSGEGDGGGFWFYALLITGVLICLPKLVRPFRSDKTIYRDVARWLNSNTEEEAVIVVPDLRISFYADRTGIQIPSYEGHYMPERVGYVVRIIGGTSWEAPLLPGKVFREIKRFEYEKRDKDTEIVVLKIERIKNGN